MKENNFSKKMAILPDEDLAEIAEANEDQGYIAEAINAAKSELASRNLEPSELDRIQIQAEELSEEKSNRPYEKLPFNRKIIIGIIAPAFFIFSVVFIFLRYSALGYKRKNKEAIVAMLIGYAFWFGLSFSLFILSDLLS